MSNTTNKDYKSIYNHLYSYIYKLNDITEINIAELSNWVVKHYIKKDK